MFQFTRELQNRKLESDSNYILDLDRCKDVNGCKDAIVQVVMHIEAVDDSTSAKEATQVQVTRSIRNFVEALYLLI